MRNPLESWEKSESCFWDDRTEPFAVGLLSGAVDVSSLGSDPFPWEKHGIVCREGPILGRGDLRLAQKLIRRGAEHRKFLRQIIIWADLTLPRYVWQELDTYKVATVRNSCSTMHKLGHRDLTVDDFQDGVVGEAALELLNVKGRAYREHKNYEAVRQMKKLLPEGFLQKATYTMSYETALAMFMQRRNHRLPEWRFDAEKGALESICNWIWHLPYMQDFIILE